MYLAYAGRHKYKAEVMSLHETGIGGVKEAIVEIAGDGAYSRLKFESGPTASSACPPRNPRAASTPQRRPSS